MKLLDAMFRGRKQSARLAYFSMEVAVARDIPNYAGGLGVLAADTLYSCADKKVPMVGISLAYHKDDDPLQAFPLQKFFRRCKPTITVRIENRDVKVAIWKLLMRGTQGSLPLYLLSTYLPENEPWDRDITKHLYASDRYYRLCQEAILGIGGVRALEALGYTNIEKYHLNEGHCALATLELLRTHEYREDAVRSMCTFTTHTPVNAGHDVFEYPLAYQVLGDALPWDIRELATHEALSMTHLALNLSRKANGVSVRHREICETMFPGHSFEAITNGVYHPRWVGGAMQSLFDMHVAYWRQHPEMLAKKVESIPEKALARARAEQKHELITWLNSQSYFFPFEEVEDRDFFDEDTLTIGFARRFVPYKRPELIFRHLERLRKIGKKKIQLVFAGHCHAGDEFCNALMDEVAKSAMALRGEIRVALVPNYHLEIAERLVSGCDVWLNNPVPPQEASGTSGMKVALNGGLNLSIADGWWREGTVLQPRSGWAFGSGDKIGERDDDGDATALLDTLEDVIACYEHPKRWMERVRAAIALGSFFNTHRMIDEYETKLWHLKVG